MVSACTAWKLNVAGREAMLKRLFPAPIDLWREALAMARNLWRWEVSRLLDCPAASADSVLRTRWMRSSGIAARLRGWAYVARSSDRGYWLRWLRLARRSTPRNCVYAAAFALTAPAARFGQVDVEHSGDESWRAAAHLLPVTHTAAPCRWEELAREVGWNYRRFLVGTRA
jgi:hypothetical protein